ncbi:PP2C family protein-serine/threonine phosphatase [Thermogutta sp.]|uniref:PP2C family protein-serine/threonine phosphatase n=1 Tax=Thermogutta sp. TaxID=1962930 RepID=UPI003220289E
MDYTRENLRTVQEMSPRSLRIVTEEFTPPPSADVSTIAGWRQFCRSFLEATGCLLRFIPGVEPTSPQDVPVVAPQAEGAQPEHNCRPFGHLRIDPTDRAREKLSPAHPAVEIARSVAGMLGEILAIRTALWEREAELAAGIPLIPHPEEAQHLARRLEEVLRAAATAVGAQGAAVYLLDASTSYLKVRAVWGLPLTRLLAPPRMLKESLADLEAMLGHAVALETAAQIAHWRPPEPCASAVCLPISTPTIILGTLWVFAQEERSFSERDIDLLEVTAGRVAAELEREAALQTALQAAHLQRQLETAQRLLRSQLPVISPLVDGWELAGWLETDRPGGAFYDWCCGRDGRIHFAMGEMPDDSLRNTLVMTSVRSAWRALCQYAKDPGKLVEQLNLTLWTGSAGDQAAAIFCGLIDPRGSNLRMASAGAIHGVLITPKRHRVVPSSGALLGIDPESGYTPHRWMVPEGSILVVATTAARQATDAQHRPLWETQLLPMISSHLHLPVKTLIENAQGILEERTSVDQGTVGILMIKRRNSSPTRNSRKKETS